MPSTIPAARFARRFDPATGGRYRVALYVADFTESPVTYRPARVDDRRTLKAAARRLAHYIARQSRRGYTGERFDYLYIITPEGERLPLAEARKRIRDAES